MNKCRYYIKNIGVVTSVTWFIAAIMLGIFTAATYGGVTNSTIFEILLIVGNILTITSVAIYNVNLIQSVGLFMLAELSIFIGSIVNDGNGAILELLLVIIAFLSILIQVIKKMQKESKDTTHILSRAFKYEMKPHQISAFNKFVLYSLIVSFVFIQARQMVTLGINLIGTLYMVLPVVVILMMIVGIREVQYIRLIYFISWVIILNQANSIMLVPSTQIIEPILYIIILMASEFDYVRKKLNKNC